MTKLTSRDRNILWSCGVSQVLTTSQILRWHFGSTSLRNVQKRLQKLVAAGFLKVIETRVCTDNLLQYRLLLERHPLSTVLVVAEKDEDAERLVNGLEGVGTTIPIVTVSLPDLKEKGLGAIARARSHLFGTRTIAEQLEIDIARLQSGETAVKGEF